MKNRLLPILIIVVAVVCTVCCTVLLLMPSKSVDTILLNEIRTSVESNKNDYSAIDSRGMDIIVIDLSGNVHFSTVATQNKSYDQWLNYAHQNDLIIMEYSGGRIFVFKTADDSPKTIAIVMAVFSVFIIGLLTAYWLYIKKTVFSPFSNLKSFAREVSIGNLDSPMLMDKHNAFGAFTESFDIMREQLKLSKEKEIALEKSKKELVASLSHDIKTPIASIKAVSEVLLLGEKDDKKLKNIEIIRRKASEIDDLVTNMFNVTLQDLSELKIQMTNVSSKEIESIIIQADHLAKIESATISECLVLADRLRLQQVIGNIVNNSYKYADTKIVVSTQVDEKTLNIEFVDFGSGVADEELPLITGKFFRGKNCLGKDGAGLGLYICKEIMQKMGGMIDCYNTQSGFAVKISLSLA